MFRKFKCLLSYSSEKLALNREITCHKVCYKPKLNFLKYRISLTNSLSNRIVYRSQYLRSYKDLRYYYTNILRANFLNFMLDEYKLYLWKNFKNKDFLLLYSKKPSTKNLDHALLWRGEQTNSLFNVRSKILRKKKKNYIRHRVFFISGHKRLLFVWRWLSIFIKCSVSKKVPRKFSLIPSIDNFLLAPQNSQIINEFKLHVYKLKLVRVI